MPITYETYGSLDTIILENKFIRAVILPSKGADLLELIHKESDVNALYRSDLSISAYDGLDLSKQRLTYHSDKLLGGYMDVLPHRGLYKGRILEQEEGGIAATLPWEMEVVENSDINMEIKFKVLLPIFPLYIERTYTLTADRKSLHIREYVKNTADAKMLFTWTQHALFGVGLLKGNSQIEIPSDTAFKAWEQVQFPERPLTDFISDIHNVKLKQGIFDLTKPPDKNCKDYEFVVFRELLEGRAAIINHDIGLGISFHWDILRFPYLRAVYRHEQDGPLVGLEPSNDMFSGWEHSERHHTYTTLEAEESLDTWFELGFFKSETTI